jgi:beclin 1
MQCRHSADGRSLSLCHVCLFSEEQNSVKQKIRLSMEQLARMKRTNVYDDTFHISYDGHFGTINGFRLGQLPSLKVEWTEINAAFGQVVLLLHTIARQANFKFTK